MAKYSGTISSYAHVLSFILCRMFRWYIVCMNSSMKHNDLSGNRWSGMSQGVVINRIELVFGRLRLLKAFLSFLLWLQVWNGHCNLDIMASLFSYISFPSLEMKILYLMTGYVYWCRKWVGDFVKKAFYESSRKWNYGATKLNAKSLLRTPDENAFQTPDN